MELERIEEIAKEKPKFWIYTGQMITPANSKDFSKEQRSFWNTAFKAFSKRKFYFMYGGQQFVTPFKLADGSFDSVQAVEVNNKHVENLKNKIEQEKLEKQENHE